MYLLLWYCINCGRIKVSKKYRIHAKTATKQITNLPFFHLDSRHEPARSSAPLPQSKPPQMWCEEAWPLTLYPPPGRWRRPLPSRWPCARLPCGDSERRLNWKAAGRAPWLTAVRRRFTLSAPARRTSRLSTASSPAPARRRRHFAAKRSPAHPGWNTLACWFFLSYRMHTLIIYCK